MVAGALVSTVMAVIINYSCTGSCKQNYNCWHNCNQDYICNCKCNYNRKRIYNCKSNCNYKCIYKYNYKHIYQHNNIKIIQEAYYGRSNHAGACQYTFSAYGI